MKAVIETTTGAALYLLADHEDAYITETGLHGAVRALDIRPETHSVVEGVTAPDLWVGGGVLSHNGEAWVVRDDAALAAALQATKAECIAAVKKGAATRLAPTDWYVTRWAETNTAIPEAVATQRAAIRAKSNEVEAAINGALDHAGVKAAMDFYWPVEEPATEAV